MRRWRRCSSEVHFDHPLLSLEVQRLEADDGAQRRALVLGAPDWVNVIPLLEDGRVVMVRQWRFGIAAPTLEIPGGIVEEDDPAAAALRELREETGYRAGRVVPLGEVSPNPAILTNRCRTYLATELVQVGAPQADVDEELTVELVPLAEVPARVRGGEIHHALVVAAFHLLAIAEPAPPLPGR